MTPARPRIPAPPVKGHPSIYECIIDLVGAGRMGSDGALLWACRHGACMHVLVRLRL
ncbi:MAG: hypothetical protein V4451_18770 [Pseudomonadota bacterium]